MKILLYKWKAHNEPFLLKHIEKLGYNLNTYEDSDIIMDEDKALEPLVQELKKGFDAVVSCNFFKYIAVACSLCRIPYISWTADSPMLSLYDASIYFDTNYFFCFDSEQYIDLKNRGATHVEFFPLLVDTDELCRVGKSYSPKEYLKYKAEVSFVGSLYDERNIMSGIKGIPDYVSGYFDGIIQTQLQIPEVHYSNIQIAAEIDDWLKKNFVFEDVDESQVNDAILMDNLIDREVTAKERRLMLEKLQEFNFKLYTMSDTSEYPKINNCGVVDYINQMPKVFALSDININVSLRSIRRGIPQRIIDVIASGGFLMTNPQSDLFYFFEDEKNIVTFNDLDDMREKVIFYLAHDDLRKRIIEDGRKVVKEHFDYQNQLKKMFDAVGI